MRIVVSVKPIPGGDTGSQATRYVSNSDRDEAREGREPRKLFSDREEGLSFWRAERVLTEGRTPAKNEIVHFAISFRESDYRSLGKDESSRQQRLKEIVRETVPRMAEELRAVELTWVAGIHRNTDNPHVHLLVHRDYIDRETRESKQIGKMPDGALANREREGRGQLYPGRFSLAFESALGNAQERARISDREVERTQNVPRPHLTKEEAREPGHWRASRTSEPSFEERLLALVRRNPSPAGRELMQEIILRVPEPAPSDSPNANDPQSAFRVRTIDAPDYRTRTEQADWIGRESQEMRDLYERGAVIKGDWLILPAEEYELNDVSDRPFITSLSYALDRIADREQAQEFHALAQAIAGESADARTGIEIFRHYYDQIRQGEVVERTLAEMRSLAGEMARLETRQSVEGRLPVVSFEEIDAKAMEPGFEEDSLERWEAESDLMNSLYAPDLFADAGGREPELAPSGFSSAARIVNLREEALRFPAGLSREVRERLVAQTLPAIDRHLESGRDRTSLFVAIDATLWERQEPLTAEEIEERKGIGRFLKAYTDERLKDPETQALNRSSAFRHAHKEILSARTPEELNRSVQIFLRGNLEQSHALRLHLAEPEHYPAPQSQPLDPRERTLLFYGRAPEHHTAEMRALRYAWGQSRAERAAAVRALHEGKSVPSAALEKMLMELDTRQTLPAIRHYHASLLNEKMDQPGKLDLHGMYARLAPPERTYLIERIEDKKQGFHSERTIPMTETKTESSLTGRLYGAVPLESASYREYITNLNSIEQRLLAEAIQKCPDDSVKEGKTSLPREERNQIRQQARLAAWEQIAPADVYDSRSAPASQGIRDTVAHLRDDVQERARLARQVLQEFTKEHVEGKDAGQLPPSIARRWEELNRYATVTREELYRGFESLDALRHEINRAHVGNDDSRQPEGDPGNHREAFLQQAGYIDSTERWHFDSLPQSQESIAVREQDADRTETIAQYEFDHGR